MFVDVCECVCRECGGRHRLPPEDSCSLSRGHSPRLATSSLTSPRRAEHAGLWITRAGHEQSHFLSQFGIQTHREKKYRGESESWRPSATSCARFLHSHAPFRSYSVASGLFTPAQTAQLQYWEQTPQWSFQPRFPPTLVYIKTQVSLAWINIE